MNPQRLSLARRSALLLAILFLLPATRLRGQDSSLAQNSPGVSADQNSSTGNTSPAEPSTSGTENSAEEPNFIAQPLPTYSKPGNSNIEGLRARSIPDNAYGETTTPGIPYSSVLTPTGADVNNIDDITASPLRTDYNRPANLGNAEGNVTIQAGRLSPSFPFVHPGTEPQDADIKAGPLYIKFHYLDGLVLYDDNYLRQHTDRRAETLVLLRLNMTIIAQLSEDLQFAISGSLDYLPLQNQFGIESSAFSSLGLLLGAPLFATQLVYDTIIAGWPVRFADDFYAGVGGLTDSTYDNFDLFQGDYLYRNADGSYNFRSPKQNTGVNSSNGDFATSTAGVVYLSNVVSAETDRLVLDDVRLTVRLDHENYWYNQNGRGLPPGRDDLYAALVSERPNTRFKPFVSYEATYVEDSPGITQTVQAGIFGPIDDQLFLRASAGYYFDANHHDGALYRVAIDHTAGQYTSEHFIVQRVLSPFNNQVTDSAYYLLQQTLGPTLYGSLFLAYDDTQDLIDGRSSYTDKLGGLQHNWSIGPKTDLTLAGIFHHQDHGDGSRMDIVTGRATLSHALTDSLTFQLLYQYQRSSANNPNNSYYENLFYVRLVKFFD